MILSNFVRTARMKVELSVENLQRSPSRLIERRRERLASLGDRLKTLSPEATLQRGYSLTARADDGRILKTSEGLEPGERLRTRLYSGEILSEVIEANHGKA
jgi:exodeoxyribonuclease VII large subunit